MDSESPPSDSKSPPSDSDSPASDILTSPLEAGPGPGPNPDGPADDRAEEADSDENTKHHNKDTETRVDILQTRNEEAVQDEDLGGQVLR